LHNSGLRALRFPCPSITNCQGTTSEMTVEERARLKKNSLGLCEKY
jgi:hypothetical protein